MTNVQRYWLNFFDNVAGACGAIGIPLGLMLGGVLFVKGSSIAGWCAFCGAGVSALVLAARGLLELYLGHRRALELDHKNVLERGALPEAKPGQLSLVQPTQPPKQDLGK